MATRLALAAAGAVLWLIVFCNGSLAFAPVLVGRRLGSSSLWMSNQPETVAIIGGGIAGLSCAQSLAASGDFLPTVFDTGRLRPGGRCSSRFPGDEPKEDDDPSVHELNYINKVTIDHAAQILSVPPGFDAFGDKVKEWEREGIVRKFPPKTVCNIANPFDRETKRYIKSQIRLWPLKGDFYYGVNGMGVIPQTLAKGLDMHQDVWVSPSSGVRFMEGGGGSPHWRVQGNGKQILGKFDRLVIAHNGKCADRLMSRTPARDLHKLLQVNFAPYVPRNGGKRMTLNSIYSLTVAVRGPSVLSQALPKETFISGFVKNHPNLRFLSCNTRKHPPEDDDDDDGVEVWTVLSSAKFGKSHKGPQEFLPTSLREQVTELLLVSLEESLALTPGQLSSAVLESRLQLWGAAVPVNTWRPTDQTGFLYDEEFNVGACGDWLLDSSIAGAWESGRRLAQHMSSSASASSSSAGLEGKFEASVAVDKVGIGAL